MKAILVIADGMADRPIKELGGRTPLEAANRPSLNHMTKTGICGLLDPISPGRPPGSDVATLALLGYDAIKVYSGRGALEALGSGVKVLPGDVAFRCNFATVDEHMTIIDRRAGRIANEDAAQLAKSLQKVRLKKNSDVNFLFKSTIQHRAVLSIRGPKLSTAVSGSDPGVIGSRVLEAKPLDDSSEARLTANIVNELTLDFRQVLKEHPVNKERVDRRLPPANIILCRGAGTIPNIKPFSQIYNATAACVAAAPLVRGICKAAEIELINVKGATGTPSTNYLGKARAAVQALKRFDLVLLHVKATDVSSHDGDLKQKIEVIEKVDGLIRYLLSNVDFNSTYMAVTADHTTSVLTGNHEGDPVPLVITGPSVRRDSVEEFSERSCAKGGLNRIRGMDLMPTLMNFLGKTPKFGA